MALVPSMLFVVAGLVGGWYLSQTAQQDQAQAALAVRKVDLVERFLAAVMDERDAAVRGSAADSHCRPGGRGHRRDQDAARQPLLPE